MGLWAELSRYLWRPIFIYIAAMFAVRLMGKRALGQLSLFDLVIMVGIGDIVVLVGLERKIGMIDGLIMLGLLGVLEILMSLMTFRWRWFANLIEGRPTPLVKDGRLLEQNMRREHISLRDLEQELRKGGLHSVADAQEVVLEACGKISVVPKPETEESLHRILAELAAIRQDLNSLAAAVGNGGGGAHEADWGPEG